MKVESPLPPFCGLNKRTRPSVPFWLLSTEYSTLAHSFSRPLGTTEKRVGDYPPFPLPTIAAIVDMKDPAQKKGGEESRSESDK